MIPLSELLRANFAAILPGINMLMYAIVLIVVIRFRPSGILGWYMNSRSRPSSMKRSSKSRLWTCWKSMS